MINTTQVA